MTMIRGMFGICSLEFICPVRYEIRYITERRDNHLMIADSLVITDLVSNGVCNLEFDYWSLNDDLTTLLQNLANLVVIV